jgi:hypothetical protein
VSRVSSVYFEVVVQKEGRATIEEIFETDKAALACAKALLTMGSCEMARVIRIHQMPGGEPITSVIFEEEPAPKPDPTYVVGTTQTIDVCETLDDLYKFPSRLAIGQLFRKFLDANSLTATELLYTASHLRRLEDAGMLIASAIHQIATKQAEALHVPIQDRLAVLRNFSDLLVRRAFEFLIEQKKLPRFDQVDVEGFSQRLRDQVGEDGYDFAIHAAFSSFLSGLSSLDAKLMLCTSLLDRPLPQDLQDLFEGVAADTLSSGPVVMALFGALPPLRFISDMLALITGAPAAPPLRGNPVDPDMVIAREKLRALFRQQKADRCKAVLMHRFARELSRDMPLDKDNPRAEEKLLDQIMDGLKLRSSKLDGGTGFGADIERAVWRRRLRLRQNILRREGLYDAADALGTMSDWGQDQAGLL